MAARKPATLRCTGTNRSGPVIRPIRRCPSATRWATASSVASPSSQETKGAAMPGTYPLIMHDRQRAGDQRPVAVVVGGGVGVQAGDEDDAGDLPVQQHLHVLVLGHPAGVWVHSTGVKPLCARVDSITWAKAGKIGLSSSGTTRPTRPALRLRSRAGRS